MRDARRRLANAAANRIGTATPLHPRRSVGRIPNQKSRKCLARSCLRLLPPQLTLEMSLMEKSSGIFLAEYLIDHPRIGLGSVTRTPWHRPHDVVGIATLVRSHFELAPDVRLPWRNRHRTDVVRTYDKSPKNGDLVL